MNKLHDTLRQLIGSFKGARVKDVDDGGTRVFRISDSLAFWNRAQSDADKRLLLHAISEHLPSAILLLDTIDEDIAAEILTGSSSRRIDRAIALPSKDIGANLHRLNRGVWLSAFFESARHLPGTFPGDVEATTKGILDLINLVGARAAILAGPDSVDWLVAVES